MRLRRAWEDGDTVSGETAIRVSGVSHQFGGEGEARFVRALLDTSLEIARGELLCLIGPSGCGKSTLLSIIGGLMAPSSGSVEVGRKPVRGPLPREIAYVFQENALFPWSTVIENVKLGMLFQGVPKAEQEKRARHSLAAVGLADFADYYPGQLSGGMRQRAALLRTLLYDSDVMLLDEPFGALDAQTKSLMQDWLLQLWADFRKTVLFVTHDLDEALFLSDEIYVLSQRPGRIKARIAVDLPRPRQRDCFASPLFIELKARCLDLLFDNAATTTH
jgi:NitT/TauT family transport system ATP-binding protein